ncbi:BT4734/BF3469 family protein [Maribellus sp. YY47]|uniref:BT4734/BF3469 family protein n=1 Tax=Maribellus sp. YY47 TaxID=2929486 RepID=UPI002001B281|nr:BT4734/BF3469 family protein [Maribellus sp. YY47]MCK3683971.1 hypothetical protein [Maribellus sp. YY47]
MLVSIFENSTPTNIDVDINQIVDAIKSGTHQHVQFSPSGVIKVLSNRYDTLIYSGLCLLTYKAKSKEELNCIFKTVTQVPTTLCCFRNESGTGLNVLIKTDCWEGHHQTGYTQVFNTYQNLINLGTVDFLPDENILCQLSHDPNLYYNPECRIFEVEFKTPIDNISETILRELNKEAFEKQVIYTEQRHKLTEETFNDFFGTLASNCFNAHIPLTSTLELIYRKYGLSFIVKGIVKRVYKALSLQPVKIKDPAHSIHFRNFQNYKEDVENDEIIFFEALVYYSRLWGIPFYYSDKKIAADLRINRHRRKKIVDRYKNMGFLSTFQKKVYDSDKFATTHYFLNLDQLPNAARELMIDPKDFLKTMMPLLMQKKGTPMGYSVDP